MSRSTTELESQVESLLTEVQAYNAKPTKATSKRIRMHLGSIKKQTASLRQELVALDSKGY